MSFEIPLLALASVCAGLVLGYLEGAKFWRQEIRRIKLEAARAERDAICKWLENQTWHEIPSDPYWVAQEIRALGDAPESET